MVDLGPGKNMRFRVVDLDRGSAVNILRNPTLHRALDSDAERI